MEALTTKAGELSELAEEEMRRGLEEEAQVWHEAAENGGQAAARRRRRRRRTDELVRWLGEQLDMD